MSNSAVNKRRLNALKNAAEALHEKDPVYKRDSDRRFIVSLIIVITLALSIRLFITEPTLVDGDSMYPTLLNGERMLVEKVSLWFSEPQRGDIVICYYPGYTVSCVKRVIGLPGETVSIENGIIYINGKELEESAYWKYRGEIDLDMGEVVVPENSYIEDSEMPEVTVPERSLFVVGDNRNNSKDSRAWGVGAIPYERITGRAHFVIWPLYAARSI